VGYKFVRPTRSGLGTTGVGLMEDDTGGDDGEETDRAPGRVSGVVGRA
jgi:hypothetical protein